MKEKSSIEARYTCNDIPDIRNKKQERLTTQHIWESIEPAIDKRSKYYTLGDETHSYFEINTGTNKDTT